MPETRKKLYLVDAMSNIHRAYHAIARLSTSAGKPTNAIYAFVTMLRKMLREHTPDLLAIAWDGPQKTIRHETYSEYKANRVPMAPDLASQIADVREVMDAYKIPVLELPGYEADDVIGTLSKKASEKGLDVVIVTADKDMLQLVSPGIRVYHTGREKFIDEPGVEEFFGVKPSQVIDVLALMGDSVDNVPGVPGVGQVTARKWISAYGDLDTLLARAGEIKGKVGDSLREHKQAAILSRTLVTIPTDLPIPFEPAAFERTAPDARRLRDLFVKLEFHSLAEELGAEAAAPPELPASRLAEGAAFAGAGGGPFAAAMLRAREKILLGVAGSERVEVAEEAEPQILERWRALDRPGRKIAIADAKPIDTMLERAGQAIEGEVFDVCLAQYVLSPGVGSSEFETMAFQRLGQRVTADKEAGVGSCALPEGYAIETADRWLAEHAAGARDLAARLEQELGKHPQLEKIYREIERPLTPVLARMEIAGVAIDIPLLKTMSERMEK